ncbi:hypothetical protein [Tessaracoccus coleopterorum]|nr:hypothetical protein [Tessaracoccus coleopterorum]
MTTAPGRALGPLVQLNPAFSVLGIWSDATHGLNPPMHYVVVALGWACC